MKERRVPTRAFPTPPLTKHFFLLSLSGNPDLVVVSVHQLSVHGLHSLFSELFSECALFLAENPPAAHSKATKSKLYVRGDLVGFSSPPLLLLFSFMRATSLFPR